MPVNRSSSAGSAVFSRSPSWSIMKTSKSPSTHRSFEFPSAPLNSTSSTTPTFPTGERDRFKLSICSRICLGLLYLLLLSHERRSNLGLISYRERSEFSSYNNALLDLLRIPRQNSDESLASLRKRAADINGGVGVRSWGTTTDEGLGLLGDAPRWKTLLTSPVAIQFVSTDDPASFREFYEQHIVSDGDTCAGHSHNDYEQAYPLITALEAKFCSLEADVVYCPATEEREESLRLGHTDIYALDQSEVEANICAKSKTLEEMYIEPLLEFVGKNPTYCQSCGRPGIQLIVDMKDPNSDPGLALLSSILLAYEDKMAGKMYAVLSGVDEVRAITSPYFKYPNLVVDGRPIDVFLPEFLRPAFVNTLIAFWVLVVIGERAKKRKLERDQRFKLNFLVQITKHILGLIVLLLCDATILSLCSMAALVGYVIVGIFVVLPLAIYYWFKFLIGIRILCKLTRGNVADNVRNFRKDSDADQLMLLRNRTFSDDDDGGGVLGHARL
mmetsp:Transcript_27095/g.51330  ORF Transcript_27095/g.51330 Transcript_27095/m.51330 type:complete len:500 (+) Transcript_27095:247-1746(+)